MSLPFFNDIKKLSAVDRVSMYELYLPFSRFSTVSGNFILPVISLYVSGSTINKFEDSGSKLSKPDFNLLSCRQIAAKYFSDFFVSRPFTEFSFLVTDE